MPFGLGRFFAWRISFDDASRLQNARPKSDAERVEIVDFVALGAVWSGYDVRIIFRNDGTLKRLLLPKVVATKDEKEDASHVAQRVAELLGHDESGVKMRKASPLDRLRKVF